MNARFWRALAAFLALPGIVAFAVPWWLHPRDASVQWWGLGPLAAGVFVLLWCVRDFYRTGRGTLAPWSPPERLVRIGLYRFSRNPMYIGVALILIGWALLFASRALGIYAACVIVAFHLRVVFGEEPWLAQTHGAEWSEYRARVRRWF